MREWAIVGTGRQDRLKIYWSQDRDRSSRSSPTKSLKNEKRRYEEK